MKDTIAQPQSDITDTNTPNAVLQNPAINNITPHTSPQATASAQDPLAQLQDIDLPPEIGLWPPAWGWWLLGVLTICVVGVVIFFVQRHRQRNGYRALAIKELHVAYDSHQADSALYLQELSIILRRTAITGFGAQFNSSLKGDAWLQWLDDQCTKTHQQFHQGVGRALLTGPYEKQPQFDRAALHELAILWIKEHHNQWQKTPRKKMTRTHNEEAAHHV